MADHPKERQIPLILILIGLALFVLSAFVKAGPSGAAATLVAVLIGAAIQTILLSIAALLLGKFMNINFGEVQSALLKFAAATIASASIQVLIPGGGIIALFIFLALIMWLFEMELTYAILLTVVYFAVSFTVSYALAAAQRA